MSMFPENAPNAELVFFRSYSHNQSGQRETWEQVTERTVSGIKKLGKLTDKETELIIEQHYSFKCLASGRSLWTSGRPWIEEQVNFPGAYNCTSLQVNHLDTFGLLMDLAMMGCGTGAVLSQECIKHLPKVRNKLDIEICAEIGDMLSHLRQEKTKTTQNNYSTIIWVGDSRKGWATAYQALIDLAFDTSFITKRVKVYVDLSSVRPAGEKLKGFGGVSNPVKLPDLFYRIAEILNHATDRQLDSIECCLLIDEAAIVVVAGNIRRTAGIRQFSRNDQKASEAKDNLWDQDESGNWKIDQKRDALRMANHTRIFDRAPTLEECITAVKKQHKSGEGAIQWAGEALARANSDLWNQLSRTEFLEACKKGEQETWFKEYLPDMSGEERNHRLNRMGLNPCGEIIGADFMCNLSEVHLNRIDAQNLEEQINAFKAGALIVAAFLQHEFDHPRLQKSRELDPIIGVSFTGLFDFFVQGFGVDWLRWWQAGRPNFYKIKRIDSVIEAICAQFNVEIDDYEQETGWNFGTLYRDLERIFLESWREIVEKTVQDYCEKHNLKCPNRCTTVQPAGTKSLLTGASPGWHPPKGALFIRRITVGKNHPIALAAIDCGYSVVPAQSDKDKNGQLLNDPFDEGCTEWLIEVPTQTAWAMCAGVQDIDISKFSASTQFDFYMQVQKFYTRHNTSATIEVRDHETEDLGVLIYEAIQKNEGYVSAAILARFDEYETFPRMPFEPISRETYNQLCKEVESRRICTDFYEAISKYTSSEEADGPAACDSDKCLMPVANDREL